MVTVPYGGPRPAPLPDLRANGPPHQTMAIAYPSYIPVPQGALRRQDPGQEANAVLPRARSGAGAARKGCPYRDSDGFGSWPVLAAPPGAPHPPALHPGGTCTAKIGLGLGDNWDAATFPKSQTTMSTCCEKQLRGSRLPI